VNGQLKQVEELVQSNGTERTIVIIFLAIVVIMFGVFLKRYVDNQEDLKKINKERSDEYIRINEENSKKYIELISKMANVVERNSGDIGDFKASLSRHTDHADKSFRDIHQSLDQIKVKVNDIANNSKEYATKKDLSQVETKIDEVKNIIKKD
jgi:methyl-accepting chemotaxis protein